MAAEDEIKMTEGNNIYDMGRQEGPGPPLESDGDGSGSRKDVVDEAAKGPQLVVAEVEQEVVDFQRGGRGSRLYCEVDGLDFVKEFVCHDLGRPVSLGRTVDEDLHEKVDGVGVGVVEHLLEADLGSGRVDLVRVHRPVVLRVGGVDELLGGRAQQFGDLPQLEHGLLALENGLAHVHLAHDAAEPPDVNLGGVDAAADNQLGRPVVPRADVGNGGLVGLQDLGGAKVADLQEKRLRVDQNVRRLDVPVADLEGVQVVHRSGYLEGVDADVALREERLVHVVALDLGLQVARQALHRQVLVHAVVVVLVRVVVVVLQRHDVRVVRLLQDLELSRLVLRLCRHLLDGKRPDPHVLRAVWLRQRVLQVRLEHGAERPFADFRDLLHKHGTGDSGCVAGHVFDQVLCHVGGG